MEQKYPALSRATDRQGPRSMYLGRLGGRPRWEDGPCNPKPMKPGELEPRAHGGRLRDVRRSRRKRTRRSASTTSRCETHGSVWQIDASFSTCPKSPSGREGVATPDGRRCKRL